MPMRSNITQQAHVHRMLGFAGVTERVGKDSCELEYPHASIEHTQIFTGESEPTAAAEDSTGQPTASSYRLGQLRLRQPPLYDHRLNSVFWRYARAVVH